MCIDREGENETFSFKDVCLGITIDNNCNFDSHIKMCKKSGEKLNELSRISALLNKDKKGSILQP